jgi:hypothetical protein
MRFFNALQQLFGVPMERNEKLTFSLVENWAMESSRQNDFFVINDGANAWTYVIAITKNAVKAVDALIFLAVSLNDSDVRSGFPYIDAPIPKCSGRWNSVLDCQGAIYPCPGSHGITS